MGIHSRFKRAQSSMDYIILTTVVLIVIVPLLFLSTERLQAAGEAQLTEAIQNIRSGIVSVNNLGYGAATRVVVRIPAGVTESYVDGNLLYFTLNGELVSVTVSADVGGTLPTTEGLHYVNLFNNGTHVIFNECGNNIVESPEQCDGTQTLNCLSGLGCVNPGEAGECNCRCSESSHCPTSSCIIPPGQSSGYCAPCTRDIDCLVGQVCINGVCKVDPCSLCVSGEVCINGVCQPKCTSNDNCSLYPSEVCETSTGICRPCVANIECNSGEVCMAGVCQPPAGPTCGDGNLEGAEECDYTLAPGNVVVITNFCARAYEGCITTPGPDECTCVIPEPGFCGDTVLQEGEECEIPNLQSSFWCSNGLICDFACECKLPTAYCGDGNINFGEVCDGVGCTAPNTHCALDCSQCLPDEPGNTLLEGVEQCDYTLLAPANPYTDPRSSMGCGPSVCTSGQPTYCSGAASCDYAVQIGATCGCGNGILEPLFEQCEYTYTGTTPPLAIATACALPNLCNPTFCQCEPPTSVSICGDSIVNVGTEEQCDKGSANGQAGNAPLQCLSYGGDTCGLDCQCTGAGAAFCGNGALDPGEQCEPFNYPCASGYCNNNCQCQGTQCGNGVVEPGEQCDPAATPTGCIPPPTTSMTVRCQNDCVCGYSDITPPPPVACASSAAPACGGTCPPGQTCNFDGQTCICVSSCASSAPACNGACPPGQFCDPGAGGTCSCVSSG